MAKIVQLDQDTINKIAAGEVIERPAAVVKELVENAIDAKSSAITIEIKDGGISLIRITDNGSGIEADDIPLAFKSHATSKISSVEDLFSVRSLGFRGEALSSVASVAQVELITKVRTGLYGVRYVIEGGEEKSNENIGCPEGTTFIVKNLFYNTPVRRKFLKTASTEAGYVSAFVERLAVSHPDIAFKFINNGQIKLHTSGNNNIKDIIYNIYGRDIAANILPIEYSGSSITIKGFIGKPIISRGNRNYENYYINGRYIKSSIIFKAIEEAYKPYTMLHKYPFVSLYLDIDNDLIDVNVHPTKMEIRLSNSNEIYDTVYRTLSDTLSGKNLIPEVELVKENRKAVIVKSVPEPFEKSRIESQKKNDNQIFLEKNIVTENKEINENITVSENQKRTATDYAAIQSRNNSMVKQPEPVYIIKETSSDISNKDTAHYDYKEKIKDEQTTIKQNLDKTDEKIVPVRTTFAIRSSVSSNKTITTNNTINKDNEEQKQEKQPIVNNQSSDIIINGVQGSIFDDDKNNEIKKEKEIRIVGQVFLTYWIIEMDNKMFIIDQHAAHEKVMYERIMNSLSSKEHTSQIIAPPIIVTLNMREEEILKKNKDVFSKLGFEIDSFGGRDYTISAVPADMYGIADKELFLELLDSISDNDTKTSPDIILAKTASMACKAAVKGNNKLSALEAEQLIKDLMNLDNPYNCPHGRPTIISLTKSELEKKFKRQL